MSAKKMKTWAMVVYSKLSINSLKNILKIYYFCFDAKD